MIDATTLRHLGWNEDLISQVVRTAAAIGPQPAFLDVTSTIPAHMYSAGIGSSYVIQEPESQVAEGRPNQRA